MYGFTLRRSGSSHFKRSNILNFSTVLADVGIFRWPYRSWIVQWLSAGSCTYNYAWGAQLECHTPVGLWFGSTIQLCGLHACRKFLSTAPAFGCIVPIRWWSAPCMVKVGNQLCWPPSMHVCADAIARALLSFLGYFRKVFASALLWSWIRVVMPGCCLIGGSCIWPNLQQLLPCLLLCVFFGMCTDSAGKSSASQYAHVMSPRLPAWCSVFDNSTALVNTINIDAAILKSNRAGSFGFAGCSPFTCLLPTADLMPNIVLRGACATMMFSTSNLWILRQKLTSWRMRCDFWHWHEYALLWLKMRVLFQDVWEFYFVKDYGLGWLELQRTFRSLWQCSRGYFCSCVWCGLRFLPRTPLPRSMTSVANY